MSTKHKHYDCIVAWAEGKEIEVRAPGQYWGPMVVANPVWKLEDEYRIKPEPKADLVHRSTATVSGALREVVMTFDHYTGEMKSCKVVV